MKLEGTLDTFPLRELVDMIAYSSVTGALNVYGADASGHLFFRDGQLYHADCGTQRGIDALARLLEHEHGQFAFVSDATTSDETMWSSAEMHLQVAERLAQRWRQVRPYIPDLDLIPELVVPRESATRRVGPGHHELLQQVNGVASVRAIATALGWSEIDVAEVVVQLSLDGVLSLRRQPAPPSGSSRGQESSRAEGGIFDRLLAHAGAALPVPSPAPLPAPAVAGKPQRPSSGAEETILRLLRS